MPSFEDTNAVDVEHYGILLLPITWNLRRREWDVQNPAANQPCIEGH